MLGLRKIRLVNPVNWQGLTTEAIPNICFLKDASGDVIGFPIINMDATDKTRARPVINFMYEGTFADAGGTITIWTPGSGKQISLARIVIHVSGNVNRSIAGKNYGLLSIYETDGVTIFNTFGLFDIFLAGAVSTTPLAGYTIPIDFAPTNFICGKDHVIKTSFVPGMDDGYINVMLYGTEV